MKEIKEAGIQDLIHDIRGQKVMLDRDLARLYGVENKRLNESVKRNLRRFPEEFMFQLTEVEWKNLRSQIATLDLDIRKYRPYAFSEHGILMLSGVLNSDRAIEINIQIMKIFVHMRHYALSQNNANEQIMEIKRLLMLHIENTDYKISEHDKAINQILIALNNLIEKPPKTKQIGFRAGG